MATAEIHGDGGVVTRPRLLRWIGLAILVGIGVLLVSRIGDALFRTRAYTTPSVQAGVYEGHCAQFIAIAKAAYGVDWKQRLDPRDTTCAAEVQAHWQSEWNARQPMQPLPPGTMRINQPTPPVAVSPVSADAARARNPETYCLNMISLARSRSGANWASSITPEDAAGCGDAIRAAGGR
jgi:hypothetical protein